MLKFRGKQDVVWEQWKKWMRFLQMQKGHYFPALLSLRAANAEVSSRVTQATRTNAHSSAQ